MDRFERLSKIAQDEFGVTIKSKPSTGETFDSLYGETKDGDRREKEIEEIAKVIHKGELDRNKGVLDCTEFTTAWINDYDFDEIIEYHIEETADNYSTELQVYPISDCFNTREEAEKALAERRKH